MRQRPAFHWPFGACGFFCQPVRCAGAPASTVIRNAPLRRLICRVFYYVNLLTPIKTPELNVENADFHTLAPYNLAIAGFTYIGLEQELAWTIERIAWSQFSPTSRGVQDCAIHGAMTMIEHDERAF